MFRAVAAVLALGIAAAAGEGFIREARPMPRAQIIRGTTGPTAFQHEITLLDGQPVWSEGGTVERRNDACQTPESYDVLLLGSSIFYGTSYGPDEVMSAHLQAALDAGGDGPWCVHNYGQPAFVSKTKMALATEAIPRLRPELVVWEMWHNDPGGFTMLGPDAYNLTGMALDADGYPWAWPMPASVHHRLFHASRLYEYAVLALAARPEGTYEAAWRDLLDVTMPRLRALTEAHGGELIVVFTPFLDRPFAESAKPEQQKRGYAWARRWVEEERVVAHDLAVALSGESVEALRHDTCCHYSAAGHAKVGGHLATWVREARARRGATGGAP